MLTQALLYVLIPLAFFGAGVLFASLVWGKYKQLAITLKQRNDALAAREAELDAAHVQTMARLDDVQTTCHTLEEEIAFIADERESLRAELEENQARLAGHQAAVTALAQAQNREENSLPLPIASRPNYAPTPIRFRSWRPRKPATSISFISCSRGSIKSTSCAAS